MANKNVTVEQAQALKHALQMDLVVLLQEFSQVVGLPVEDIALISEEDYEGNVTYTHVEVYVGL